MRIQVKEVANGSYKAENHPAAMTLHFTLRHAAQAI